MANHPYSLLFVSTPGNAPSGLAALEHTLDVTLTREQIHDELVRAVETAGGPMATLVRYQFLRRVRVRGSDERRVYYYAVYAKGASTLCRFRRQKFTTNVPIQSISQIETAQFGLETELGEPAVVIVEFSSLAGREAASEAC